MEYFKSEINSVKNNNKIFKLSQNIYLTSPKLRVMYPIQERYGQIQIKLEFSKIKENSKISDFYNLIQSIENYYSQKFFKYHDKTYSIKSQINQYKNYDPFLIVKVPIIDKTKRVC